MRNQKSRTSNKKVNYPSCLAIGFFLKIIHRFQSEIGSSPSEDISENIDSLDVFHRTEVDIRL